MNKKVLKIFYNQRSALKAFDDDASLLETMQNRDDIEISKAYLTITTSGITTYYKSGKSITRSYFLGNYFNEIYGMDHIENVDARNEIKTRIKEF